MNGMDPKPNDVSFQNAKVMTGLVAAVVASAATSTHYEANGRASGRTLTAGNQKPNHSQ